MSQSINRRTFTIATGAAVLSVGVVSRAMAQEASPVAGGPPGLPPLPEGAVVYAQGLLNPRYMAFADDGTLYVTEVGTGGDEPFMFGPPAADDATPEAAGATPVVEGAPAADAEPTATRGYTGQVSAIAPDGSQTVVVSGLASYSEGVGPHGVAIQNGMVYFTVGGTAVLAGVEPLEGENALFSFDPASGEVKQIAEFNTYEIENNSDGTDVNPNVYAVSAGDNDGRLTVNDAGSNTIFSVDAETGEMQLKGVVPDLAALTPEGSNEPRQPVPTGGTFKGNSYYVSLLSEFWPEDGPSVLKVDGDGMFATFTPMAFGLSYVTGLATGPDGNLYVSQLFDDPNGPPVGSIHRVLPDTTTEPVVEGLVMPHGIVFDGDGNLFVTTMVLMSAPGQPAGQIVRIDGIAAPA